MYLSPEFYNRLEFLSCSIGVILGFYFGIVLLFKQSKNSRYNLFLAIYLLAFSLRTGKALFHNYYDINEVVLTIFLNLILLIGPSLWFYVNYLFDNAKNIKKSSYYLHYAPFVLAEISSKLIPNNGGLMSTVFYFVLFLHGFIYSGFTLYWLLHQPKVNSSSRKLAIKRWLIIFTLATILTFVNTILIFFDIVSFYPGSAYIFSFFIIFLTIYGYRNIWIFEPEKEKYSSSTLNNEHASLYVNQLFELMKNKKPYLDPDLTLLKLANMINLSSKELSQVINQNEQTNYSQYITIYRVKEAKEKLANPDFDKYKISTIAYESGFNSISSFNIAFRKYSNITAIEYRESIKNLRLSDNIVCQNHEFNR